MSGAPKIASASASGARKKNSERERERRSEKSGSARGERRSEKSQKITLKKLEITLIFSIQPRLTLSNWTY